LNRLIIDINIGLKSFLFVAIIINGIGCYGDLENLERLRAELIKQPQMMILDDDTSELDFLKDGTVFIMYVTSNNYSLIDEFQWILDSIPETNILIIGDDSLVIKSHHGKYDLKAVNGVPIFLSPNENVKIEMSPIQSRYPKYSSEDLYGRWDLDTSSFGDWYYELVNSSEFKEIVNFDEESFSQNRENRYIRKGRWEWSRIVNGIYLMEERIRGPENSWIFSEIVGDTMKIKRRTYFGDAISEEEVIFTRGFKPIESNFLNFE